jgi:hypothetical protein
MSHLKQRKSFGYELNQQKWDNSNFQEAFCFGEMRRELLKIVHRYALQFLRSYLTKILYFLNLLLKKL